MAKQREYKDLVLYLFIGLMLISYIGVMIYFYKTGQVDLLKKILPKPIAPPLISQFIK